MSGIALQVAGDEVADDDAAGTAFHHDKVHHFASRVQFHRASGDLTAQGTVCAEQQLLSGLAFGIEGTAHLCAAERSVVKQATVVAGERHALGHTLVDDGPADFCQTVHIGLTGAVVASLDGIAEEAFHAVAVVLVILCRIDATLGSNTMGTTG